MLNHTDETIRGYTRGPRNPRPTPLLIILAALAIAGGCWWAFA